MQQLSDCKEKIHSCSKCGLCQAVCPIYKITGNDCTVSRGQFIMLYGLLNGKLQMSKKINKYLDLCLKCGACSKFCPSGIDVVEIVTLAKAEYFKQHKFEKIKSFIQKKLVFDFGLNFINFFHKKTESKKFDKKVIYFGGCSSKIRGNDSVIKILNRCGIEVITRNFDCCGIPFYVRGDLETFKLCKDNFIQQIKNCGTTEVVTTCASCEKTLKSYNIDGINIKNIFEYLAENDIKMTLKKPQKVTFHKPCNINNYDEIKQILNNIDNLTYVEMENFDKCCGLNGVSKINEYKTMCKLFKEKRKNILNTEAETVLTCCLGCEFALKLYSAFQYKVCDLTNFLEKNISD